MPGDPPAIVDAHVHVFDTATTLTTEAWQHREHPARVEALQAEMVMHGVTHAVLATAGAYRDNSDFGAALANHRNLRATAVLPPVIDTAWLARMSNAGFVGTRLFRHKLIDPPDLGDAAHRRLFRLLARAGWHVHLTEHPDRMARTLDLLQGAGLGVVVDHLGLIDRPEGVAHPGFRALLAAVQRGKVWVKLSGVFRFAHSGAAAAQARALIEARPDRLFWASDWPFVGHRDTMSYAQALDMPRRLIANPAHRSIIMGGNALDFYFG